HSFAIASGRQLAPVHCRCNGGRRAAGNCGIGDGPPAVARRAPRAHSRGRDRGFRILPVGLAAMNLNAIDPFLVVVVLLNFFLLGTGRMRAIIYAAALQGAILGIIYPLAHHDVHTTGTSVISLRLLGLAAAMIIIKGFVMPKMLTYA